MAPYGGRCFCRWISFAILITLLFVIILYTNLTNRTILTIEAEFSIDHRPFSFGRLDNIVKKASDIINENVKHFPEEAWLSSFKPRINQTSMIRFEQLIKRFVSSMEENSFTYMMYGGTLIGSYRHHGFIPWDDDLDFIMDFRQRRRFLVAMKTLGLKTIPINGSYEKVVDGLDEKLWPFIHVMYFATNKTHMWDVSPKWSNVKYNIRDVFPLRRRPYENVMLPSPHNVESCLRKYYIVEWCLSNSYSHITNVKSKAMIIGCEVLRTVYPMVNRTFDGRKVHETLTFGNDDIGSNFHWTLD